MTFEEFEKVLLEKRYGIVAMNHYGLQGKRYLYCAILRNDTNQAYQAEALTASEVFEALHRSLCASQ